MDDQAFLRAICETPDDDAPRLVYADWLEEHGRPERAEFIRVQIELAKPAVGRADRTSLRQREQELLVLHHSERMACLSHFPEVKYAEFERGFLAGIAVEPGELFLDCAATIFATEPVTRVELRQFAARRIPALAKLKALTRLTHLDISRQPFGPYVAEKLAASPHLRHLESLTMWDCGIGDSGASAIANSASLTNLKELVISYNQIGPAGAEALATSPNLAQLNKLVLSENRIGAEGGRALIQSRHLRQLTMLYLNANRLDKPTKKALRQHFGSKVCRL